MYSSRDYHHFTDTIIDDKEFEIIQASEGISAKQQKEIYERHKKYAKQASNLSRLKSNVLKPAMYYERLILQQRIDEIDRYLGAINE